jgi:hypothetical protein
MESARATAGNAPLGALPSGGELLTMPRPTPDALRQSARKYT